MRRNLALIVALVTALAGGAATSVAEINYPITCIVRPSPAAATRGCPPRVVLSAGGGFVPKALPRHEMSPIALAIEGKISNSDGSLPPALIEVTLNLDKNGAIDATGLPVCTRSQLEMLGVKGARRTCRKSIVGAGIAHVAIGSSEQGPMPLPLTFFNGGVRGDATTLLIHSSVPAPSPHPIVAAVKLRKANEGRYGLLAVVPIPPIAGGSGSVLDFSFKIKRLLTDEGTRQSYAMARCPDGHLNARLTGAFKDGTILVGTLVRSCTKD